MLSLLFKCYVMLFIVFSILFFHCTFCKCALRVKFSSCATSYYKRNSFFLYTVQISGWVKKRNRKHICIWRFLQNIFKKSASKKDQKALKSCRIFSSLSTHLTVRLKLGAALRTLHCKLPLNYRFSPSSFMFAAAIVLVLLLSLSLVLFSTSASSVSSSFPPVAIVKVKYLRAAADVIHRRKRQWKGEKERERKRTGMIKMATGHQIAIRLMGRERERERQLSTIEGKRTSIWEAFAADQLLLLVFYASVLISNFRCADVLYLVDAVFCFFCCCSSFILCRFYISKCRFLK